MTLATLRDQGALIHENMAWRKQYLESTRAAQTRVERDAIVSKIDHLAPCLRALYLKQRLAKLKLRLLNWDTNKNMTKTLEEWSAALRPVPTMVDGLADIAKDFKLKLPDRHQPLPL